MNTLYIIAKVIIGIIISISVIGCIYYKIMEKKGLHTDSSIREYRQCKKMERKLKKSWQVLISMI